MIFRAFLGEPCPEARELEDGHLAPRRGAVQPGQRRDRGHRRRLPRPRAPHRRARAADEGRDGRCSRCCAIVGGVVQIPWVDARRRQVPRADVRRLDACTASRATACIAFGLVLGTVLGARRASRSPTASGSCSPGTSARVRERFAAAAPAVRQQVVLRRAHRPRRRAARAPWFGRFGQQTFERVFVNGVLVGGTTGVVQGRLGRRARAPDRLPARLRRAAAARRRRRRPLLPDPELVNADHLSILLWLAAVVARARRCSAARRRASRRCWARRRALVLAIVLLVRFDGGRGGLQFVTDETWISELGIHYKLGVDGLNLVPRRCSRRSCSAPATLWATLREWERPRLFYLWFGLAESGVLGALLAQDLALFVDLLRPDARPVLFLTGGWGARADRVCARRRSSSSTRSSARC